MSKKKRKKKEKRDGTSARVAAVSGARPLRGVSEIRSWFRTTTTPVWFVSATAFNLLGMDRWVRRFGFVNYYDSFEGLHPHVFVPRHVAETEFDSIEAICNYLLAHKEVVDHIRASGPGKAVFLMFDEETEELAAGAGLEVAFPPAALRHRLDSKIETTRLGNEAGVPSVPNVLGRASSWNELLALAAAEGLGQDLVVQTPYGDSGQTTFFLAGPADWEGHAGAMAGQDLKVMKRIECREAAIEGVITRHGTLVGPLMTELTGYPELTPYGGGWCGNDVFATALSDDHRRQARLYTQLLGERLRREGYRGYFELDFLAEMGSGEMYLGELNPRVTGASSITNVTAVAYGDMPLFLFHLLEFMDVEYEIDVDALNRRWAQPQGIDEWSQFILKDTADVAELITAAPTSGIWRLDPTAHGGIRFVRRETDWHTVASEDEAFYLRIAGEGHYRYPGADLGILVTRGRLQTDDHRLTERAHAWIHGIKKNFWTAPLVEPRAVRPEPFSFKML
jgi:biotin carboxylase